MELYQNLWNQTRDILCESFAESTFNDIFGDVKKVVKFENGIIYVLTPSTFIKTKINNIYTRRINTILQSLTNEKVKFKFVCENEIEQPKVAKEPINFSKNNLNPNYTFESLVIGEANRLGYLTSMKVAEQLGQWANPLYIFGGVGLGKTHMMQAIGNYVLDDNLDSNILYVQANDYI